MMVTVMDGDRAGQGLEGPGLGGAYGRRRVWMTWTSEAAGGYGQTDG